MNTYPRTHGLMKDKGHVLWYTAPLGVVTIVCASFLTVAPALAGVRDTIQTKPTASSEFAHQFGGQDTFASALISAKGAMAQDYPASVSAVAVLGQAKDDLGTALHGLVTGDGPDGGNAPTRFSMDQNYPNPFNPTTTIKYQLPNSTLVRLSIYDMLGREVSVLVNERKEAGVHEVKFDAANVSSGVYLYQLRAGNFTSTKNMLLLK